MGQIQNVDYETLDRAKAQFVAASRRTVQFASKYGFVPGEKFGASANLFALDLAPFLKSSDAKLYLSLIPEGLGTADDARPDDLSEEELRQFWWNMGIKTVSVLTNDAASSGLQTILIGLYLPSSTPEVIFTPPFMQGFLDGFVEGCKQVGCVYFSGETPQLKGKIVEGKLDIAGALAAILPAGEAPLREDALRAGNSIVMIESSGPHENGFTVLRRVAGELPKGYRTPLPSGTEYWRAVSAGSKLYTPLVRAALERGIRITGIENITGHGWQKIMRSPKALRYRLTEILPPHEIFRFVEAHTGVSVQEMLTTFNYGSGMAIFTENEQEAARAVECAASLGLRAIIAGTIEEAPMREVVVEPLGVTLKGEEFQLKRE